MTTDFTPPQWQQQQPQTTIPGVRTSAGEALVHTVVLAGIGYMIGRCLRGMSVRGRWMLLGVLALAVFWFLSIDSDPYSESGETTPMTYLYGIAALVLLIATIIEERRHNVRQQAAYYAAQQAAYDAQQARRPAAAPQAAQQRTERSVTVVRAPQPATAPTSTVRTYKPSDVQRAIAERSVRRREDHGSFTINDRRGFDPELGE